MNFYSKHLIEEFWFQDFLWVRKRADFEKNFYSNIFSQKITIFTKELNCKFLVIWRPRETIFNSKISIFQRKWPLYSCENGILWIKKPINPHWHISGAWHKQISGKRIQIWTSIPEIGLADAPEIEFSKKYWMSFPGFANRGYSMFSSSSIWGPLYFKNEYDPNLE